MKYREFKKRQENINPGRTPYFLLAAKYFPTIDDSIVVDIGAGEGQFVRNTEANKRFKNLYLLDGNESTVCSLINQFPEAKSVHYLLPDKMLFEDGSVSFIHLSHIIEHLTHDQLYMALKEIDRVLKKGGILVISTPLMWNRFWDDLSHIRPYNPAVLRNYLITSRDNATGDSISEKYKEIDFSYRYKSVDLIKITSKYYLIYKLLKMINYLLIKVGFRRYVKNGYTIVLRKD